MRRYTRTQEDGTLPDIYPIEEKTKRSSMDMLGGDLDCTHVVRRLPPKTLDDIDVLT
jgi:hypothetical protein